MKPLFKFLLLSLAMVVHSQPSKADLDDALKELPFYKYAMDCQIGRDHGSCNVAIYHTISVIIDDFDHEPINTVVRKLYESSELTLDYYDIADLSPLSGLVNLKRLDLSQNRIEDLSALSSLTQLTHLDLSRNWIQNVAPLSKIPSLIELDLGFNHIQKINPP